MPQINQFRDRYRGRLNVIAVHMPRSESDLNVDEIIKVAAEHKISQPIFVDHHKMLTEAYGNKYVPAYYLFNLKTQNILTKTLVNHFDNRYINKILFFPRVLYTSC